MQCKNKLRILAKLLCLPGMTTTRGLESALCLPVIVTKNLTGYWLIIAGEIPNFLKSCFIIAPKSIYD
jgi:hypothetical protein